MKVPHEVMNAVYPSAQNTDIAPKVWQTLVRRADDLIGSTDSKRGFSGAREAEFLNQWVSNHHANRLFPQEQALVPLFTQMTADLPQAVGLDEFNPPPVKSTQVVGTSSGLDLGEIAERIAATRSENLDGESTLVPFQSLAQSRAAMTEGEWTGIQEIYRKYFAHSTVQPYLSDAESGIKADLEARYQPTHIEMAEDGLAAKYSFELDAKQLHFTAPAGSQITAVAQLADGSFLPETVQTATADASGKAQIDLTAMAELRRNTSRSWDTPRKLAIFVVNDKDGITDVAAPQASYRAQFAFPGGEWCTMVRLNNG